MNIFIMGTAPTPFRVRVTSVAVRNDDEVSTAKLSIALKPVLGRQIFEEQQGYLSNAAAAAWASFNGNDRFKKFRASVLLKVDDDTHPSLVAGSSSSGLGYALSLYLQWSKDVLGKNLFPVCDIFTTGEISPSGGISKIGFIEQKLKLLLDRVDNSGIKDFYCVYPSSNEEEIPSELRLQLEKAGARIIAADNLGQVLHEILGLDYDGASLGRWEPFKGLKDFEFADSGRFFGRERPCRELLLALDEVDSFMVVTGSSGAGKSSLLKAGIIPELLKKYGDVSWSVFDAKTSEISITEWINTQQERIDSMEGITLLVLDHLENFFQKGIEGTALEMTFPLN